MSESPTLSAYIVKLNHPIKEIRERSLRLLQAKLRFGWELEDELSSTRDILQALLNWFHNPQTSLEKEVLDLFLSLLKTKSGNYIAKEFGIRNILSSLLKVKPSLSNAEAMELYSDLVETLEFLNTIESDINVGIPRLNIPSITSSESEGGFHRDNYNVGTLHSKDTSISNVGSEYKESQFTNQGDGIKISLFPWVELSPSDSKTILMIEDALKLLKSVRRCCRFIRDVFLRDFPADIFLNRPTIIKNLLLISEGVHRNQSDEALLVLLYLTRKLLQRQSELSCTDLVHDSNKFSGEQCFVDDNMNTEVKQIAENGDIKMTPHEDYLAALKQLPAPIYALDTMNSVLPTMVRSIASEGTNSTNGTLSLKEINICLNLLESLMKLLFSCVSSTFWNTDHKTKTHRDIAHKSCMVMRLLGDLLMKYRNAFTLNCDNYHHRSIWLRLVVFGESLLSWARESALPPSTLVAALHVAQLDPALQMLYPKISEKVSLALQTTKTTVDQEYKSKYKELMKLTSSMDDAVKFMKNKNNCRNSKAVLAIIKKSLPVLELHMSEAYLDDVSDILLKKSKDLQFDNNDWNSARSISVSLMAHNVEWVRAKFYSKMAKMVKYVLVGDESNQPENEKCLTLFFDVAILTELCCHGLSSKTKQVEISSTEIMLYLLRGRLIVSEQCWWRLLAALTPVFPLLHAYAAHDTQLGKAICKSLDMEIASCMGVSASEVLTGLTRLLFVRCVAVQLDAAHSLCRLLDDSRYLPPKEALRANVLMNALKRVKCDDFNVDTNSSTAANPQITGLLQILDVLKQDIILDEKGTEYITRDLVQPMLEPSLRRSTLQQLAVLMRQQDLHDAFLTNDGLRVVVAVLRMSLMVDDYLAFPECSLSCVSILNSIAFTSRHSLAKVCDLPMLLIRVILVFPANDSAVLMTAQVLALIAWSGFALQELDADRKRVPALPACVTQRTLLPFRVNSYWNTSSNAEHSSVEWLSADDEYRSSLRVRWWCAYEGASRVCHGAPPPPAPLALIPNERDRTLLRSTCLINATTTALLALENATAHAQVNEALALLESYIHLVPWSSAKLEEFIALPWQHMHRFLRAPPASSRDIELLISLMHFILIYMNNVPNEGSRTWIKSSFIGNDATILSLLSREQMPQKQTAQESIEVSQLHIHIVKVLLLCVKQLEHDDYDCNKLESLLKILLACLERIDLKNFHALGYLNELMCCIRYVLHSRYCKLSEETLLQTMKVVTKTFSGCASGGGRKGQACRLDAVLSLLMLLRQAQEEGIPVQRWSEVWNSDVMACLVMCKSGPCAQLRAASLRAISALAHYPQLMPHLVQATREESLMQCAVQIFTETQEANIVRAAALDLIAAISARASPHSDVLEKEVLEQLKSYSVMEHCLDILVGFQNDNHFDGYLEPNVPLSLLERCSELEVRSQKCDDVHVSPSVSSRTPPPTVTLITSVAEMIHNVSAFAHFPVQAWNEQGIFKLLFRCTYWSHGSLLEVARLRGAASRALVAVTSHKCVRASLSSTKDCLHNLLRTFSPLQEEEMYRECLDARAHSLSLLASLLADSGASESVWADLKERQHTAFFCCLLQAFESDESDLQASALYCLTLLAQSTQKKCPNKSWIQYYDNIESPFSSTPRSQKLTANTDCMPEYMAEELCKVLIKMYKNIELDVKKYQCGQNDIWARVCSCLASVLSVSARSRQYGLHRELPIILMGSLQGVRDHLSVLRKPVETIKNSNHNPVLRTLYWLLTVINSSMIECLTAKESFAENGIATSLNRLWPWCMMTDQLRQTVVTLLYNFTNECPKAWSSMSTCVGKRNLITEVCVLTAREAALQSSVRADTVLAHCVDTLRHCACHHQCRAIMLKSEILLSLYKTIVRERGRSSAGVVWSKLCCVVARYADGAWSLLALKPVLLPPTLRAHFMQALAHAAHHQRTTFLQSPDLLELLSGTLLAGDTSEIISAARAVWALSANNHKAKLLLRSAGVAAAVQSALQRLLRSHSDATTQRALQLLTYTNTVLQAT